MEKNILKKNVLSPILSIIIPFRNDHTISHLIPRLSKTCSIVKNKKLIEFIVVDSGSDNKSSQKIKEICDTNNIKYVFHPAREKIFSIGAARDYGVKHASGKVVTFIDIDFRFSSDFWSKLLSFIEIYGVLNDKKMFFVVPILYLTQLGTIEFEANPSDALFYSMFLKWLRGNQEDIQNLSPSSSIIVVNRLHYLSVGGHRKEFRGHGYEDFDLIHRLLVEDKRIPRANNYYKDTKAWDASTYNGFRSQFALLGRAAMMFSLYGLHLWHPRPKNADFYNPSAMQQNRDLWTLCFKEFDQNKEHPEPLISVDVEKENLLFFGTPRSNNSRCFREIFPILGTPHYVNETTYVREDRTVDYDALETTIKHLDIKRIVFPNPYGNETRQAIYKWCKKNKIPFLVFDRGALPFSWFFDPTGFNADSNSYNRSLWDKQISEKKEEQVLLYINYCLNHAQTLEKQGERIGGSALAEKLQVGRKKVLFVPLQRPSDSVIKYFSGDKNGFEKFVKMIDKAAEELTKYGWIVLVKKHPLETKCPHFEFAQYAPNNTNFIDLLELCSAVALINSGVGLYAMMADKPCYIFGKAFYQFDGINVAISGFNASDFTEQLLANYKVDKSSVIKFIHYLKNTFYSFGIPELQHKTEPDGSKRSLTRYIDFREIRVLDKNIIFSWHEKKELPTYAPLFERYKLYFYQEKEKNTKDNKKEPVSVTKTAPVVPPPQPASLITEKKQKTSFVKIEKTRRRAKMSKFIYNPRAFFSDSKHKALRPFKIFFPKKNAFPPHPPLKQDGNKI